MNVRTYQDILLAMLICVYAIYVKMGASWFADRYLNATAILLLVLHLNLTVKVTKTPFNAFAYRVDPDQGLLCLLTDIWFDMICVLTQKSLH